MCFKIFGQIICILRMQSQVLSSGRIVVRRLLRNRQVAELLLVITKCKVCGHNKAELQFTSPTISNGTQQLRDALWKCNKVEHASMKSSYERKPSLRFWRQSTVPDAICNPALIQEVVATLKEQSCRCCCKRLRRGNNYVSMPFSRYHAVTTPPVRLGRT